ncbi:c-type cytochrome biogenesis protein CcmI [Marinobacter nauticus]
MTETFWIAATVFILFALAFVLYPVFFHRPRARIETDLRNQNLLAYRSRLKELEREHESGILDDESFEQLKEELAGAMLDDVPENQAPEKRVPGRRSAIVVVLLALVVLPVGTYLGYERWGSMDQVEQFVTMQEMESSGGNQAARMAELAEQLRTRLEQNPDNAEGWAMLGQTYMRIERYQSADEAYRRLASVVEGNADAQATALGLAAQARFFANQGQMTPEVREVVKAAQALNPDEVNSLGLEGIYAFGQENYREAIDSWERILEVAPDHPQAGSIREGVAEAYRRLGETPPTPQAPERVESEGVDLRISLAEDLKQQVAEDTTLFIFARPSGTSGGAPVAVARMTAGNLPADIRLDDNYAMSPQSAISGQDEVVVVARLSRSGSVNPQPGDLEGQVMADVKAPGQGQPVQLVIDKQLTN